MFPACFATAGSPGRAAIDGRTSAPSQPGASLCAVRPT